MPKQSFNFEKQKNDAYIKPRSTKASQQKKKHEVTPSIGSLRSPDPATLLSLQRSIGNRAVQRLLQTHQINNYSGQIQPLTVNVRAGKGNQFPRFHPIQRMATIPEESIPVQTDGNCGLFSIIGAMKAFGFSSKSLSMLEDAMDKFVAQSEETFVGEVFTVDLMVRIVNGILFDDAPVLTAKTESFSTATELQEVFDKYKDDDEVALLIGYSKPDEYDNYYKLRGQYLQGVGQGNKDESLEQNVDEALDQSIGVKFKAKDAHWGMINGLREGNLVDIADTITESEQGSEHGYNTLIGLHSLFESNQALSKDEFDWSGYIEDDEVTYNKLNKQEITKDLTDNKRYKAIKSNSMSEKMQLTGKLVVIELTKHGRQYVAH